MERNKDITRFVELCARSRHDGLAMNLHQEKKDLANKLIEDGHMVMTNTGCYGFVNENDSLYFAETIKNWNKK